MLLKLAGLAHLIQRDVFDSISLFKAQLHKPFFMEIIVAMFWATWSARNDAIFRNLQHSLQSCMLVFKKELDRVKLRAKKDLQLHLQIWLDDFV